MNAHGKTIVSSEGRVIKAKFIGAFNSTGVLKYANKIKSIVNALDGAPFAILVDDLELEGGTPHAYEALEVYNQWLNKQPLIAKAMLTKSLIKIDIITSLAPSHKKQNVQVFEKEKEALVWLKSELAKYEAFHALNKAD